MTREEFKRLAAGNFALSKATIDPKEMAIYIDGAIYAWDSLNKHKATPLDPMGIQKISQQWNISETAPTQVTGAV